jgi:uncharacterized protein (DUF1800 family)
MRFVLWPYFQKPLLPMASLAPLQGSLGKRRASHLLRRASYRYTKSKVNQLAGMDASTAATLLLTPPPYYLTEPLFDDTATTAVENIAWMTPGTALPAEDFVLRRWVVTWWLSEAYEDPGALHRMITFMHQFNVSTANAYGNNHFFDYLALLRWGAFGNWKKLAFKLIFDNNMLRYLNNTSNTASNPQENFAREFIELFTIGKGPQAGPGDYTNYTEDDIVQAAKVLTGCRTQGDRLISDPETGIPMGRLQTSAHNWTEKKFSARFQNLTIPPVTVTAQKTAAKMTEELNIFVDMIFAQDETAKNFCRRLYRYYVNEKITPEIETDIIVPLAATLKNGNYEIKPLLKQLLSSQHFYGEDNTSSVENIVGGIIRSPLEAAFQSVSFFGLTIPSGAAAPLLRYRFFSSGVWDRMLTLAGMNMFQPSDVAGYSAYYQIPDFSHQWFNSSSIIARYKLPAMLLSGKYTIGTSVNSSLGVKLDIVSWTKNSGFFSDPYDAYLLVQELVEYLLPKELDESRFNYFYDTIFLNNLPPSDWTYEWENYLATGVDGEVKIALERLINAIMYSQEYQTF